MADIPGQALLNEAALKRLDPYIKKVLDSAKFVALYSFKLKENRWEKTGVEGSLFVYSRTGEPFYNILVLNRLSATNLIEPITSKLILQLHEPFLLYLNSKCCLYGMWFYEKEECVRLASLIDRLAKEPGDRRSLKNVMPLNGTGVDIFNMLSRAQEAYNTTKTNGHDGTQGSPQESDQTPQSVMEFFAKAGNAPKSLPSPQGHLLGKSSSLLNDDNAKLPLYPPIHNIMSNPVHLVEHIEKQQRLITPYRNNPSRQSSVLDSPEEKPVKLENEMTNVNCMSLPSLFSQTNPNENFLKSQKKPELLPPAMFSWKDAHHSCNDFEPEPLTKNQLLHAINYLLKNDSVFMTKIHEAYIKSFNR